MIAKFFNDLDENWAAFFGVMITFFSLLTILYLICALVTIWYRVNPHDYDCTRHGGVVAPIASFGSL